MASNSFGTLFKITTWGESHGRAIGVVIDGCPAGLAITEEEINEALFLRRPGQNAYTSPRKEKDRAEIFSGVYQGVTTGAPISLIIFNTDANPGSYAPLKNLYRPGHANFTYLQKYGQFDERGGGRASARETACRVAAGAIAKKLLQHFEIEILAYIHEMGGIQIEQCAKDRNQIVQSPIFCPDAAKEALMLEKLLLAKEEGDSLGAVVALTTSALPCGLGDPVYEKLEANLAKAMLSLPASKGVEFGKGFEAARMCGSEHNDAFILKDNTTTLATNHSGGTLGGISTGMPLELKVAFKPTSSIKKVQQTVTTAGSAAEFTLPPNARHDPCVAIRAVPIVEAMCALVLADALLLNRCAKL